MTALVTAIIVSIRNGAISLSKEFSGKKRMKIGAKISKTLQKINKLKMVFRTNRRSLKYAPKELSKVNTWARDSRWCYKNTQYSRQHRSVTDTNPEWYVATVSQRRRARLIFKQRCHVTTSSWIKISFLHAGLRTSLYGRDLIHESLYTLLHFSCQQRNKFLYFCSTIVNNVFSFINISILQLATPYNTPMF